MKNINIKIINQLQDNYSYVIHNYENFEAIIIDPAESGSLIDYLKKNSLNLNYILVTHHHDDHTSGIKGLISEFPNIKIFAPGKIKDYKINLIKEGTIINSSINNFEVYATPGHTLDHVVLYDKKNKILFSGDTLFRLGCGRVFEGTYEEMHNSLKKINKLEDDVLVYCGHEYTKTNLEFLKSIFRNENEITNLENKINTEIQNSGRSIPFNLGIEKKVNPFLSQSCNLAKKLKEKHNFSDIELFSFLRDQKNKF